ncbi:MAG: PIG-L family deacetylase [Actinomycetota bacterium]|nr:PIG-L family deacetylase [Actinomycetota bacterium]
MRGRDPDRNSTRFTLVSFHAHPDDEALLTGGTLARAAAEGHRVVLVTATSGERGLAGAQDGQGEELGRIRVAELRAAAKALGCARVVSLGYGDSGLRPAEDDTSAFANVDVESAARRLADLLSAERADVLTIYDRNGGYGHPDHLQVHRVGTRAAQLAETPVVLDATVSAGLFRLALRVLRLLGHAVGSSAPLGTQQVFSDRREITHRVRVTGFLRAKRAAMAAHDSQRRAEGQTRVMDYFLRLPLPAFGIVFGREWFIEHGRTPGRSQGDVFATLRTWPRETGEPQHLSS